MSGIISIEKSKPSNVKRINLLPRFGLVVDFAGYTLTYRHAPVAETLLNLKTKGFSAKNLMSVALEQLKEINLGSQPTGPKAKAKRKTAGSKRKARTSR